MSVIVEGKRGIVVASPGQIVEEDRELAWASPHVRRAPDVRWLLGNFVHAATDEVPVYNANGHLFPLADLRSAVLDIPHRPLNYVHQHNRTVGCFTAAEFVWPEGTEQASESEPPTIEALAAFWRYYDRDKLWPSIEMAYRDGELWFCVDEETEVLTEHGWRRHDDLHEGDLILTMDTVTETSHWLPCEKVNRYQLTDQEMVRMEGMMHSSLTTPNHRWWVRRKKSRGGNVREWRTSDRLTSLTSIPRAVPYGDFPAIPVHSDAFVELVSWFWTEGTVDGRTVVIYQSPTAHPANVERIRLLLTTLFGPPNRVQDGGVWYESREPDDPTIYFHLSAGATNDLLLAAPDRVVSGSFLRTLTSEQLHLFINTSMAGDGTVHHQHQQRVMTQSADKPLGLEQIKSFEMACALAGIPTNTIFTTNRTQFKEECHNWHTTLIRRSNWLNPPLANAQKPNASFIVDRVPYTGTVWCPTTPNGTFLARRRGTVYWTGNSMEAIPEEVTCMAEGCGQTFEYDGPISPIYCSHMQRPRSKRRLNKPHFLGGALIVPPTKPGDREAHVKEISALFEKDLANTDHIYREVAQASPHLDNLKIEHIVHYLLSAGG